MGGGRFLRVRGQRSGLQSLLSSSRRSSEEAWQAPEALECSAAKVQDVLVYAPGSMSRASGPHAYADVFLLGSRSAARSTSWPVDGT